MNKQVERKQQSEMTPEERTAYIDGIINEAEAIVETLRKQEDEAKLTRIATVAAGFANMIQR